MPIVPSSYRSPRLLRGGHAQTIVPALLPRPMARWTQRAVLELPDGDFLDLCWLRQGSRRLAILSHGLEGSADAPYMRGMARTLRAHGWDVLAWSFRGCGGRPNRLLRAYHSGGSDDLRLVVDHAAIAYDSVVLVGFSLGGNVTLKYLGEAMVHPKVRAAAAVSAPVDLASSARLLDERGGNAIYLRRFLRTLITKTAAKAPLFPGSLDITGIQQIRTIREFDERFTAPQNGFAGAEDYWARASALPLLAAVSTPALLLNARNDPLLGAACFPEALSAGHRFLHLEAPESGGHVGFLDFAGGWWRAWHEWRVATFLNQSAV